MYHTDYIQDMVDSSSSEQVPCATTAIRGTNSTQNSTTPTNPLQNLTTTTTTGLQNFTTALNTGHTMRGTGFTTDAAPASVTATTNSPRSATATHAYRKT